MLCDNDLKKYNFTELISCNLKKLYDFPDFQQIKLLKYSENIIFKISFRDFESVVFRVHRPGYHTIEELQGELLWMDEVRRETDVLLPKVYCGKNGEFIQQLKLSEDCIVNCSVISFLPGEMIGELKGEELTENIEKLGEITAKLHVQSIKRNRYKSINRFSWDEENFFSEKGVWGSWRAYKMLSIKDVLVLEKCQEKIIEMLNKYGRTKEHYGLIHGDLHFFNVMIHGDDMYIFDFDDCGYGFYMYDLGCTLVTYSENIEELVSSWVKGYEKIRSLTDEDKNMLEVFILLRRIMCLAWLASHADSDTAKTVDEKYLEVTIKMASVFCMLE